MQILSGSIDNQPRKLTPFEQAESNVTQFMMGMHMCWTWDSLADRITLINSMLSMPIMSSSSDTVQGSKKAYTKEMAEIEHAIKMYASFSDLPEA